MMSLSKSTLLMGVGVYYGISYFFFKHPELLHKKKNKLDLPPSFFTKTVPISHRGGSLEGPENTLQVFKHSVSTGIRYLELDVRLTKDGQLIVSHDANCSRLCGDERLILETDFNDLPRFKSTILRTHFSEKEVYQVRDSDQHQFSLLEDLFEEIPKDVIIQIDIKDKGNIGAKEEAIRLIRKHNRQSTSVLGTEGLKDSKEIRRMAPDIPHFVCVPKGIYILLSYWLGLIPFQRFEEDVLAAPYLTRQYSRMKLQEAKEGQYQKYFFRMVVALSNWTCNPLWLHLKKRGVFTNYWVINDEDEIEYVMKNTTVQGVMTDKPTLLVSLIDRK